MMISKKIIFIATLFFVCFPMKGMAEDSDAVSIAFKERSNVIYEYYLSNNKELSDLNTLIARYEDVILSGNGHIRLVANMSNVDDNNLVAINLGALRAASISAYLRAKFRFLTPWNFSFLVNPTKESSNSITISYIPIALSIDSPKGIFYTENKESLSAIKQVISKYGGIPYLNNAKLVEQGVLLGADIDKKATAVVKPNRTDDDATDVLIAIYYRWDKSNLDSTYLSNTQHLSALDSILKSKNASYIDTLKIVAFASPEGNALYNKQLSERRANTIREYILKKYTTLEPKRIVTIAKGENWQGVLKFAQADKNLPSRDKVLEILNSPMNDAARERALKSLDGGAIYYRYILPNYYPYLRNGASILVTYTPDAPIVVPEEKQEIIPPKELDTIVEIVPKEEPIYIIKYPIALRTNLLYDAIGAANIGVEMPIGDNWSIIADFAYAYWRSSKNLYALQTLEYGSELRYWFGVGASKKEKSQNWSKPLKGWNVGLYGRYWQRYDVQWIDGYQGDGTWSAGVTAGYAFPITKQLSLEASIGAGWVSTSEYRHYHQPEYDNNGKYHLMWQETGRWSGLSITKVRFSLVWLIEYAKKGGTVR